MDCCGISSRLDLKLTALRLQGQYFPKIVLSDSICLPFSVDTDLSVSPLTPVRLGAEKAVRMAEEEEAEIDSLIFNLGVRQATVTVQAKVG